MSKQISIKGLKELEKALARKQKLEPVKQVITHFTGDLKNELHKNAQKDVIYVKGYSDNNTRDALQDRLEDDGLSGVVGSTMAYTPYVEYGTRFMEAEPIFKPAIDAIEPKYIDALEKVMK